MNKKSLLVVPALGVMLLAAAGSVGGTVAWFSSVSSINTEISTFQATRLDGNLDVTYGVNANRGTAYRTDDDNKSGVKLLAGAKMTHASFDHAVANGEVSTISSETASHLRSVATLASDGTQWIAKDMSTYKVFWAVHWTMTFNYDFALEQKADLFFDPSSVLRYESSATAFSSSATYAVGDVVKKDGVVYKCITAIDSAHDWNGAEWEATEDTAKGFRIAFVARDTTNATTRVWAPERPTTGEGTPKYIANADINDTTDNQSTYTNATDYASNVLIGSDFAHKTGDTYDNKIPEGQTVSSHDYASNGYMKGYLGTFTSGSVVSLTFDCVAWFEGTDAAIAPGTLEKNMNPITAAMGFYTRENKVA